MPQVKNIKLADQGDRNIELAQRNMQALLAVKDRFSKEKPFEGLTIAMALHVTKETAVLVKTLEAGGAKVFIAGCNPLSTQDDVAAALAKAGTEVFAYKGETKEDYYEYIEAVIASNPHITIDDGCDLVAAIHERHTDKIKNIIGGCEETTTGVIRLEAMTKDKELKYPVVAVNNNKTKHLMDNYYGTGQSTLDAIMRATNVMFAGKTVVVVGYGSCGKGVSQRAKGLGAQVIVTEVDPFRALQAKMDGFRVMPIAKAAKIGNIFITVTGNKHVISYENILAMPENSIICNSGHFDIEIDLKTLTEKAKSTREMRPGMQEFTLENGKNVYVLGEGRLVNLAAAEGHPSEVMSLSFCGQALACEFLVKNKGKLKPGVYDLPQEIDAEISLLQLSAMGVKIDTLTPEQEKYLNSWQEGT